MCRTLNAEIAAATATIAAKYGLSVMPGGGSYEPLKFTAKTVFQVTDTDAIAAREKADFNAWCEAFGLTPADYGKVFRHQGWDYRLTGFATNRARPFLATRLGSHAKVAFAISILPIIKGIAA
jgi:hypothetical protein